MSGGASAKPDDRPLNAKSRAGRSKQRLYKTTAAN